MKIGFRGPQGISGATNIQGDKKEIQFFSVRLPMPKILQKKIQLTPKLERSSEGVFQVMNATMDTKRVKMDFNLTKHLPITDPSLGLDFLA